MIPIFVMLATLACCESVYVYSSFWAPLYDPKILNYKIDIKYDPDAGRNAREDYRKSYGYRGEKLINYLGNGKGPQSEKDNKDYGDVKFYYTFKQD